jgi:hypothetical protein
MKNLKFLALLIILIPFSYFTALGQGKNTIGIKDTRFVMNGENFEYTGISFFNALYNPEFNKSSDARRQWLRKFSNTGINVLRVWIQCDNPFGFVDMGEGKTLYNNDGSLKPQVLSTIKALLRDADSEDMVILLVFFSRESWNANIRLSDEASDRAVENLARELRPYRNMILQIWNEFDHRTVDYFNIIKKIDPDRLVTNSPGYAGRLGSVEENQRLDFLSPHTTRTEDRHWEIANKEIEYLLTRYRKPVVDGEPARRGTPQSVRHGGPRETTFPLDHILRIYNVWKAGGFIVYHHDMFQIPGPETMSVPENGIPVPGFSDYHDAVFEFLKNKDRYLKNIR